jgi:phosphoglycerate dehydrogenase-like enzyme
MGISEEGPVNVLLTIQFSEAELQGLAGVSPRLQLMSRPTADPTQIEPSVWEETDVLYTFDTLPDTEDAPHLRWVQFHSAGIDHVLAHPLLARESILLTTASGIHATPMAEYVFAMFLAFGHKLPLMMEMKARTEWPEDRFASFVPGELRGATLGVVGYGSVGREVARVGVAFGMRVLAIKRDVRHPEEEGHSEDGAGDPGALLVERLYPPQALRSMLRECDFVAVTAPLTEQTRHLIDAEALAVMKPSAVLVNVSRGEVVDEAALIHALGKGRLRGAGLDVFEQEPVPGDSPLWELPNVIMSPHIAGLSYMYNERAAHLFAENLRLYLAGKPLLNLVHREFGY